MQRKFARHYRRMLSTLLETLQFCSDNRFQPLLEALKVIRRHLSSHGRHFPEAEAIPIEGVVTPGWQEKVFEEVKGQTKIKRRYYELCVLQKLQRALKCKEVWVEGAHAFRNPSEDMPADWGDEGRRLLHYQELLRRGSSLYLLIRRLLEKAGVTLEGKRGPHTFRHARAVSLLRAAVPLKAIGDILGHRSAASTRPYLKLATEDLRAVGLEVPRGVKP